MTTAKPPIRLGFFTRLLDQADAAERYRLAIAQIVHAERCGFDSAWVAQHHFHEDEGGLPAPFVFLAQVAAQTSRIRLGTGIVTLPLELPIRVAEDAAVLDLMCGGRLEVGVGPGGNLSAYEAFGLDSAERTALLIRHHRVLLDAWAGRPLPGGDRLYPPNPGLVDRVWQATFSVEGARRAGAAGDGLMLSRTQPRPAEAPHLSLARHPEPDDRRLSGRPAARAARRASSPRARCSSPTTATEALRLAEIGLARQRARYAAIGRTGFVEGMSVHDQIAAMDIHIGTPGRRDRLATADSVLARATDLTVQSHSIDPPHPFILRSIELVADVVAPALGWVRETVARPRSTSREHRERMAMPGRTLTSSTRWSGLSPAPRWTRSAAGGRRRATRRRPAIARCSRRKCPARSRATERFAVAAFVTGLHGDAASAAFYAAGLAASGASEELRRAIEAAIAAAKGRGPYGAYPAGPLSREDAAGTDPSCRSGNPPRAGRAPSRGVRSHAPAGVPPARRRAGGAAGSAGCGLVDHRHRDPVADRRLPVVPDPGGRRFARPGRRRLTCEVPPCPIRSSNRRPTPFPPSSPGHCSIGCPGSNRWRSRD